MTGGRPGSPVTDISPETPCELVVLHGAKDDVVPLRNSRGLVAAHPHVELVVLDDADHFAVIDPESPVWPVLLERVAG